MMLMAEMPCLNNIVLFSLIKQGRDLIKKHSCYRNWLLLDFVCSVGPSCYCVTVVLLVLMCGMPAKNQKSNLSLFLIMLHMRFSVVLVDMHDSLSL
jgi:hypothetical protein